MNRREKEYQRRKEQTTQYCIRFTNTTGIPEALRNASEATDEATTEYIKKSVIQRLQSEGFLRKGKIVLNLTQERHRIKIEQLEKYIEQEKKKIK